MVDYNIMCLLALVIVNEIGINFFLVIISHLRPML